MTSVLIASGLLTGGAAFSFTLFFRRGKNLSDKRRSVAAKILSLVFAACFALRLAMTDVFYDTEALVGIFSKGLNFALVVLRAFTQMCVLALILAPWFKFRSVKSIVAYAVPVVYFIDMALFRQNVYAFLGAVSLPTFGFREVQFAVECVLAFSMGLIELANRIRDRDFDFSKKNILQTLALGTFYLIFAAHGSTLFNLFGGRLGSAKDFSPAHIAMACFDGRFADCRICAASQVQQGVQLFYTDFGGGRLLYAFLVLLRLSAWLYQPASAPVSRGGYADVHFVHFQKQGDFRI